MTMKKLITDTNVWYNIGNGLYDIERLKRDYDLCPTTINVLEILSKINGTNYIIRKNALMAMRPFLGNILSSNDRYLDDLWHIKDSRNLQNIYITNYLDAIQRSTSFDEFESSLSVYKNLFSLAALKDHQEKEWNSMRTDINNIMLMWKPDYIPNSGNNKYLYMKKQMANRKDIELCSQTYIDWVTAALYVRACGSKQSLFDKYFQKAQQSLLPYIQVYKHYLLHCATTSHAEENDYGDLELFLYGCLKKAGTDCEYILGTAEKKWHDIAQKASYSRIINTDVYKV